MAAVKYLVTVEVAGLAVLVDLAAEVAALVVVLLPLFLAKEAGLEGQPVLSPCALLGCDVDFEASGLEHVIRVQSFADEDTGCVAVGGE